MKKETNFAVKKVAVSSDSAATETREEILSLLNLQSPYIIK